MPTNEDQVWVFIDVHRPNTVVGFRGRCSRADYEAMLNGSYPLPFFTIHDVHWLENQWGDDRQRVKSTVYGRDDIYKQCVGKISIRTENVATIAVLKDCSEIVGTAERYLD
jgi:hypothetical protein